MFLGEFIINFDKHKKEIIVKISMIIDKNLKLKIIGEIIDGEKNEIKIQLFNEQNNNLKNSFYSNK